MKKLLLLFALFAGFIPSLQAQRGFEVSLQGAPSAVFIVNQNNYETLDGCAVISRSELDYTSKWGYSMGGSLGYNVKKNWGIYTGIRYVRTGQNYEDTFNPGTQFCASPYHVVRTVDLRYVRVPLLFRYKFPFKNNPKFKLYASVGPYIGFLLKASEEVTINDNVRTDLTPTKEKFNKRDVGMSVGVGGEYHITRGFFLSLGLVVDYGFTDMNGVAVKDLEWFSKNDVGYKRSNNFNTGVNVGIHFVFGGTTNPFEEKKGDEEPPKDVAK
ncbi:hypothetical protein BH09BAC1_BH09BAC1_17000 [soil metagenome]